MRQQVLNTSRWPPLTMPVPRDSSADPPPGTPPAARRVGPASDAAQKVLLATLAGCIAGEKAAWDRFVVASAGIVHAAVRRALGRHGTAGGEVDDRVQEVYLRLLQRDARLLRAFDPTKASLPTWLALIARTVVHEHARRVRLPIAAGSEALDAAPMSTVPGDAAVLDRELPWNALSEQQRTALLLLFDAGLPVEAVAERLGVSTQTVRSAKHKGLSRLREELRISSPATLRGSTEAHRPEAARRSLVSNPRLPLISMMQMIPMNPLLPMTTPIPENGGDARATQPL